MRRPTALYLAITALLILGPRTAHAQAPPVASPRTDPLAAEIERLVKGGAVSTMRWQRFPDAKADVARLYGARAWQPRWLEGARLGAGGVALLARFAAAESLGLNPVDYDAGRLARTAAGYAAGRQPEAAEAARFDVALTVDAWRFYRALRFGRLSPHAAHGTLELPRDSVDFAATVDSLADPAPAGIVLARAQPPFRHYRLLIESLAFYRRVARDSTLVPLPAMPKRLKRGDGYPGAARLRALLSTLGDVPDSLLSLPAPAVEADTVYDAGLVVAVTNFQRRHNLAADGAIGRQTQERLNRPFGDRIRQIELSLERWRWLPHAYGVPPIFVNLPAFRLHAFRTLDDDESTMLSIDVVVGIAYKHDTPVFTAPMRYVVFRPYWEVPVSIMRAEIRPAALKNPSYVERQKFDLVRGGEVVPPTRANLEAIGGAVRVRQRPGPANSLGNVKFMLPNPYNVYLHDTPAKSRFEVERRDFSHGCIRLSQATALAEFVLRDQPEWTPRAIAAAMAGDEPKQVYLKHVIPVYVLYATAIARQDGRTFFYDDLYGHDATLDDLLRRGYPYP
jgi:murein L,D-transpeptidase YcbB/YkuD